MWKKFLTSLLQSIIQDIVKTEVAKVQDKIQKHS